MEHYQTTLIQRCQAGVILPLLLVILAVMGLFIAGVSTIAEQQMRDLKTAQRQMMALEDWRNTREILFYALLSRPFNEGGLITDLDIKEPEDPFASLPEVTGQELRFDNTLYKGWGATVFALQDANALLNINLPSRIQLKRLLSLNGITEPEQQDMFIDTLHDYIDRDDLRRAAGAEQSEYHTAGLLPPPNRAIRSLAELKHIINWQDTDLLDQALFYDNLAPVGKALFNINTAPVGVLMAWTGFDQEIAQQLIANRPFENELEIYEQVNGDFPVPVDSIFYMASRFFRLRLYHPDLDFYEELFISYSIKEYDGHPWIIESTIRYPSSRAPDLAVARESGLRYFDPAYLGLAEPGEASLNFH